MSRHITLAAFLVTLAVVVPAAWHALDADIPLDGPALRPKQSLLHAGGATISVDLDRGVLMSGNQLKVTLVGTADTQRKVALDVRALQDNGIGEGRVENPPTVVSRRRITIEAAPGGGKPTELTFALKPRGMKPGRMEWYDVEVTPAGQRGDDVSFYGDDETPATGARVGALVWGGNNLGMRIEAPASVPPGDAPFTVKLHVKNTTRKPLQYIDVRLGGPDLGYNGMEGLTFYGDDGYVVELAELEGDPDAGAEGDTEELAPGAERVYVYRVTPKQSGDGKLGLLASIGATVVIDEEKNKYLHHGAMDAVTIQRAAPEVPAATVAGK